MFPRNKFMIFPSENMTQEHVEQNASLLWEKSKEHKHFLGANIILP